MISQPKFEFFLWLPWPLVIALIVNTRVAFLLLYFSGEKKKEFVVPEAAEALSQSSAEPSGAGLDGLGGFCTRNCSGRAMPRLEAQPQVWEKLLVPQPGSRDFPAAAGVGEALPSPCRALGAPTARLRAQLLEHTAGAH